MADDIAIRVEGVHKAFRLPHEKHSSIKGLFIAMFRGRRTFETQKVLTDISFDIKKGEFFAIVGRNGGGKSTLLKLLAGIYSPDKGSIQLNGKLTPFIELGVGFNPDLTGQENVYLNGALLGFDRTEIKAMYQDIVDFAELEKFMDQKLKNYSSGMQVRLAFSIAIRAQSDILLLDEVLAVGDAAFQQKCFDYFEKIKKEDKTVVFVTHDMTAVTRFCTKAIYIKDGKIIKSGTPAEISDLYKFENIDAVNKSINAAADKTDIAYGLTSKVIKQTDSRLSVNFNYSSNTEEAIYIGLSVLRDGISIAEITTSPDRPLHGNGEESFSLDLTQFNPGVYQLTAALFRLDGRALVGVCREPITFSVEGVDVIRGAGMKLENTWGK